MWEAAAWWQKSGPTPTLPDSTIATMVAQCQKRGYLDVSPGASPWFTEKQQIGRQWLAAIVLFLIRQEAERESGKTTTHRLAIGKKVVARNALLLDNSGQRIDYLGLNDWRGNAIAGLFSYIVVSSHQPCWSAVADRIGTTCSCAEFLAQATEVERLQCDQYCWDWLSVQFSKQRCVIISQDYFSGSFLYQACVDCRLSKKFPRSMSIAGLSSWEHRFFVLADTSSSFTYRHENNHITYPGVVINNIGVALNEALTDYLAASSLNLAQIWQSLFSSWETQTQQQSGYRAEAAMLQTIFASHPLAQNRLRTLYTKGDYRSVQQFMQMALEVWSPRQILQIFLAQPGKPCRKSLSYIYYTQEILRGLES